MAAKKDQLLVLKIESKILSVRGLKVMLDSDLADLYGVSTKRLNQQVKRNLERFPSNFMFQLIQSERDEVVANCDHIAKLKYSPTLPYAFTGQGAIMAASVLNTPNALQVYMVIVEAFVALRQIAVSTTETAKQLRVFENQMSDHGESIERILVVLKGLTESNPNKNPR